MLYCLAASLELIIDGDIGSHDIYLWEQEQVPFLLYPSPFQMRKMRLLMHSFSLYFFRMATKDLQMYVPLFDGTNYQAWKVSYPYFSQSQLQSNLGLPDLSLGIDATLDLVRPSPAP